MSQDSCSFQTGSRASNASAIFSLIPQDLGVRWACLAIFVFASELVDFAAGTPGTCTRRAQA